MPSREAKTKLVAVGNAQKAVWVLAVIKTMATAMATNMLRATAVNTIMPKTLTTAEGVIVGTETPTMAIGMPAIRVTTIRPMIGEAAILQELPGLRAQSLVFLVETRATLRQAMLVPQATVIAALLLVDHHQIVAIELLYLLIRAVQQTMAEVSHRAVLH